MSPLRGEYRVGFTHSCSHIYEVAEVERPMWTNACDDDATQASEQEVERRNIGLELNFYRSLYQKQVGSIDSCSCLQVGICPSQLPKNTL